MNYHSHFHKRLPFRNQTEQLQLKMLQAADPELQLKCTAACMSTAVRI